MMNKPSKSFRPKCECIALTAGLLTWFSLLTCHPALSRAQATGQTPQEEKKESGEEIPKPAKDDFTVHVYSLLDEKKADKLTFKDKYKQDKTEMDVDIVISYFNWALSGDDYWNRQISIETKNKEGFVIEKIVKTGFGELGYVKPGDKKTQDVFRKEKITVSGAVATATMADADIGSAEKERYRHLLEKFVLKK
jgi:hypothetical protein